MPLNDCSAARARAKTSSTAIAGCAASSASSSAACDWRKRTQSPSVSPKLDDAGEAPQPLLRHQAPRCRRRGRHVPSPRSNAASSAGRDADVAVAEVDAPVQLEPVDARPDLELHLARRAEHAPFRLDPPALLHQRADRARKLVGGDAERLAAFGGAPALAEAQLAEMLEGELFGVAIPPDEHAALIVVDRRLLAGDERAVVIELDERIEILAAVGEIGWLPAYPDGRPRRDTLNRVAQLRRKRVRREARSRERFGEPRRSVFRHQHRSGAAKLHQPWKIRTTREPSHRRSGDDESAVEDEQRLAHRHPLGIPLEHAVDSKPGRTRGRHEQLEFPRRSVVHADRGERAIAAGGRRVRAPGSRDQRQHALLQWSFQVVVVRLWIHGGAGEIAPRTLAAAQQRQDFPVLEVRELIDLVGRERQRLRPRPFPVALAAAAQHAQLGAAARDRGGHIDQVDDLRLQPAHAMRRVASRIRRALNLAQEVLPGLSPVRCRRGGRALARSIRRRQRRGRLDPGAPRYRPRRRQRRFGLRREQHRPDVLADAPAIAEVRALARADEPAALVIDRYDVVEGSTDDGGDAAVGALHLPHRAAVEVVRAFDACLMGNVVLKRPREH